MENNLEFDGYKWRRPRVEIPQLVKELEDMREELHRIEKPQDVTALLRKLTDRAIDAMSHAKDFEAFMQTLKEAMESAISMATDEESDVIDTNVLAEMVSPLKDLLFSDLESAIGRIPQKKDEFQSVLDELDGLFGDTTSDTMNMLSIQVDVDLPPDPNAKPSKSLMYLGNKIGAGVCDTDRLDLDVDTPSGFSDEDADGLIAEFLGV